MKITGWGFREILEELPFAAGLQLIHAEDFASGREKEWAFNESPTDVDSLAMLDAALSRT